MDNSDNLIDYTKKGIFVNLVDNPGTRGVTTGKYDKTGTIVFVEVMFGPGDKEKFPLESLEEVKDEEDIISLVKNNRYGGPEDIRRTLIFEKIGGDLTNIFYSMESSNTDFYPHQFKPVLKFVESPLGRILIADEVGLGKTIEAIFIWKELQARENARRLLIVCPAVLREKWRRDLLERFKIEADIVNSNEALDKIKLYVERGINNSFVLISSIEGLRPPSGYIDATVNRSSAKFARLLDEYSAIEEPIFDLVIIDEAHYLRNSETSNHKLGKLLNDASKNMILLTATPIQIGSENLFNILQLIAPDQISNRSIFDSMIEANKPIINALRHLWRNPPDLNQVYSYINESLNNDFFVDDPILINIKENIKNLKNSDTEQRIEYGRQLESRSIINQFMIRSRKRDVIENRVIREPQTVIIEFSDYELNIYNRISNQIRIKHKMSGGIETFALIMKQRQMASCMTAALNYWKQDRFIEEIEEEMWDDLGIITDNEEKKESDDLNISTADIDLKKLEECDQKYKNLLEIIQKLLKNNPQEKFVVFAFFRGTLKYLERKLTNDRINCSLIIGGMDNKTEEIDRFKEENGPNVLLSSEVGSEGIDLQFCHILINYDLPWNPMRIEQRIGRLDRLGQKSEKIQIINLKVESTIEDRIIMRLYERINVFRETIGDIEEILGNMTDQLIEDLLNPNLSDLQREDIAQQNAMAIINKRKNQEELEKEALNLIAFTDYIVGSVQSAHLRGRWLSGYDLLAFVEDFFDKYFPGTIIRKNENIPLLTEISLSYDAKRELLEFLRNNKSQINSRLLSNQEKVNCVFDYHYKTDKIHWYEYINAIHPLIQWIRNYYENKKESFYSLSSLKIKKEKLQSFNINLTPGLYVFCIQKWNLIGLKRINKLIYSAINLNTGDFVDKDDVEALISFCLHNSDKYFFNENEIYTTDDIIKTIDNINNKLLEDFNFRYEQFKAENDSICNQQEISINKYTERRINTLEEVINKLIAQGKKNQTPRFKGLIEREKQLAQNKLEKLKKSKKITHKFSEISSGIFLIEG